MRERILSEIRRLTEANSGKPPGRQAFETATGIRYHEWYGVYWARWGDAVREAGFTANKLQTKLVKDTLLQCIAEAYRHFGRAATRGDLRLYGRDRPGFPSHSAISSQFSGIDLKTAVREWASKNPDFSDVVALLPDAIATERKIRTQKPKDGSVYLIRSGLFYKIGRSDEIERRVKEIRIALPEAATLVHTITTDDPPGIEAHWHRRFADKRANGEWFKLAAADVLAFKRRKFQ